MPATEVAAFVRANLPRPPVRVLEVGAGDGRLAAALAESGYDVVAIDPEPTGENVREISLADLAEPPGSFDAAVAVVSLHHVDPLGASLGRLADALKPGAPLVVDEFDVEAFGEREATRWLRERRARGGTEDATAVELVGDMRSHLHSLRQVCEALVGSFDAGRPIRGAYLYGWDLDESFRPIEESLIASGELNAVGARLVALRR